MCLYPKRMRNRKYEPTKKNGGLVPLLPITDHDITLCGSLMARSNTFDTRVLNINVPCGRCKECLEARSRNWMIRLSEEIKETEYNYFVTLTFSPEELGKLTKKTGLGEVNPLMGIAIRRSLERWRKDNKKSLKHWFITELGHEGTERIHAHGIIFSDKPLEFKQIRKTKDSYDCEWKYWRYGFVNVGTYVSERTINYLMKYVTKVDTDHKNFIGYIFCSPGLGKTWLENHKDIYTYEPNKSIDYIRLNTGKKVAIPAYYKNKCYNEEERELIWREKMDIHQQIVAGNTYQEKDYPVINKIRKKAQEINESLGYGNDSDEWKKLDYCVTPAMLRKNQDKGHLQALGDHNRTLRQIAKDKKLKLAERKRLNRIAEKQEQWTKKKREEYLKERRALWRELMTNAIESTKKAEKNYKKIQKNLHI